MQSYVPIKCHRNSEGQIWLKGVCWAEPCPQSQSGTQTCLFMAQPPPPTLVVSLLVCGILDDVFGGIGLPRWLSVKESTCQCRRCRRLGFGPWMGKIPWRRERQPTPVFLPGKSHGQRTWWATVHGVVKESDMTEPSCTGGYSNSVWNHKGPWDSLSAINVNFLFLVGISLWQPQAAWRTCSEGRPRASIWPAAWGPWRSWYWMKLTGFWTWVLRQGTEVWT